MSQKWNFIVHIGTEKTGTTTLQAYLHEVRQTLQPLGFAYYSTPGRADARALAAAAVGDTAPDEYLNQQNIQSVAQRQAYRCTVVNEFAAALHAFEPEVHTVIISSEHFHSRLRTPEQIRWLKALLMPHARQITLVVYLRPQVDLLTSFYSTALRNGEVDTLEAISKKLCHPHNHFYNYHTLLTLWQQAFNPTRIQPRLFTPDSLIGQNVIADFRNLVCPVLPVLPSSSIHRRNESINPVGQALLRGLNRRYHREASVLNSVLNEAQHQALVQQIAECFSGPGERLSADAEQKLQSAFDDSNHKVCQQWFTDRQQLFEPIRHTQASALVLSDTQVQCIASVLPYFDSCQERGIPELDPCADYLRNSAVLHEKKNIVAALQYMELAHRIRPYGPFIQQRLAQYRKQEGYLRRLRHRLSFFCYNRKK